MKVEIHEAGDGWRWRVRARNGRIIAESGEAYSREHDAHKAWARFSRLMSAAGEAN
jgi:uncharacterized protein YegP (UPF0339 family)